MTLFPITTDPRDEHGRDGAAGTTAPPSPLSQPRPLTPRERYEQIAFRLDVTVRQAELLWFLAQREVAQSQWLMARMGLNCDTIKVHASNLRKQGFDVRARKYIGYFLQLADRERVLAAASVASSPDAVPVFGLPSPTPGGANAARPFQPTDDLTRQVSKTCPSHSSASVIETDHGSADGWVHRK